MDTLLRSRALLPRANPNNNAVDNVESRSCTRAIGLSRCQLVQRSHRMVVSCSRHRKDRILMGRLDEFHRSRAKPDRAANAVGQRGPHPQWDEAAGMKK